MIGNLVLLLLGILVSILPASVLVLGVVPESLGLTTIAASSVDIFMEMEKDSIATYEYLYMNIKFQP
jgi:hypothetical protein